MTAATQMPLPATDEQDQVEFLIPEPHVEKFRKRLNSLAKRAKKLGLVGLAAVEVGKEIKEVRVPGPKGKDQIIRYEYRRIQITGERPKLHGWTLLGNIAHEAGGNVFSAAPGHEIPERYRDADNTCEHCNKRRNRRDTMIIEKDGEILQIGRSCLQDFIGDVNVKGVTWYYEMWPSLETAVGGLGGGASNDYVPTYDYLAAVACATRLYGYVTTTTAKSAPSEKPVESTKSAAWTILFPPTTVHKDSRPPKIEEEDRAAALDIMKWIQDDLSQREGLQGYMANLKAAVAGGWIRFKHSGLAASVYRARENDLLGQERAEKRRKDMEERKARWAAESNNTHFGSVKEREDWILRVLKITEKDGDWGPYTRILFKDHENRLASLDTTSAVVVDALKRRNTYLIKATVKKHSVWSDDNATKCTVLSRAKVLGVQVEAEEEEGEDA